MPLFIFDDPDGAARPDAWRRECANVHHARQAAARYAVEFMETVPALRRRGGYWKMRVRDEDGQELFTVSISSTLTPTGRQAVWRETSAQFAS